jgi:hypothetical protein
MTEVARSAGVPVMTVSYTSSRPDRVADDIRQHVLKVAKLLGYRRMHPAAGSLPTGRGCMALDADAGSPCESRTAFWCFAERDHSRREAA